MSVSFSHNSVLDFVKGGYNSLFSGQALCGVLYFSFLVIWFGEHCIVYPRIFLFGRAGNASLILRMLAAELVAWA